MTDPLLQVEGLRKYYPVHKRRLLGRRIAGQVRAVDDISLTVKAGETLGLVGESGCGKTTTARAILQLVDPSAGRVLLDGVDTTEVLRNGTRQAQLAVRRRMQYVFQDPYLSLNPRWSVGDTVLEPMRVHGHVDRALWEDRLVDLLELVGLEQGHAGRYPHEFSGGQRQRIGIARALAVEPSFLICDEPVSSLDVSVRGQILNLLAELQDTLGLAYLYISHDLSSVRYVSHRVAVMYLGRIVEVAEVNALFARPLHHYTHALLLAIPVPDPDAVSGHSALSGEVPSPSDIPTGCRFHPRCPAALSICRTVDPPLTPVGADQAVACHNPR